MDLNRNIKSDVITQTIGDCGKWQIGIILMIASMKFSAAWNQFIIVFLAPPQDFWCKNGTGSINNTEKNKCTIPILNDNNSIINEEPCTEFTYDTSIFKSTITSEWDLVCSKAFFVEGTQMSFMTGFLIGNLVFGILSDKYGRKKTLNCALLIQIISCYLIAFSPWLSIFLLSRFIAAFSCGGMMVVSFVLSMEVLGGKWREIMPVLFNAPLGLGSALMTLFTYLVRDWRKLELIISVLSTFYLMYIWFLPESPRWFIATNKDRDAIDLLERVAIINGKNPNNVKAIVKQHKPNIVKEDKNDLKCLSNKKLKIKTTFLCMEWFLCGTCTFGLIQYLGVVTDNVFVTFGVIGLNLIPGVAIATILIRRFGRKTAMISSLFISAASFAVIHAIPKGVYVYDWPRMVFAGIGILGIDVHAPVLYLYTGESYPTNIRNTVVGIAVVFSRIGSILAPLIISLGRISPQLPLTLLVCLEVLSGIIIFPLEETTGRSLMDTFEDENEKHSEESEKLKSSMYQ